MYPTIRAFPAALALTTLLLVTACSAQLPAGLGPECGVCDDGNPCTVGSCDVATAECRFEPSAAAACDDGNACTANDLCKAGACAAGGLVACDDGLQCTDDSCSAATGCVHTANVLPCDDGSVCTDVDACAQGSCKPGKLRVCDDNDPCTTDTCHALKGCTHTARTGPCDDGSACTKDDSCANGTCAGAADVDCNDGNACTKDACDFQTGCTSSAMSAVGCDDGDDCTVADVCNTGSCAAGSPKKCDDGDPCTVAESCVKGSCDSGSAAECDDGDTCTTDSCQPFVGCKNLGATGTKCDDGTACTLKDTCAFGQCAGTPLSCDDGNACTDDSCDPASGCVAMANSAPCDDGSSCTADDHCLAGSCNAGAPLNCNSCGNGAIDGPTASAPAACLTKDGEVVVTTPAELAKWQVSSNQPLTIDGALVLGGTHVDIDTPCAVKVTKDGSVSVTGGVFIAATAVQIDGDISAAGKVVIRAAKTLKIGETATVVGKLAAVALEAKSVQVLTDLTIGQSLCVEAENATLGAPKAVGSDKLTAEGNVDVSVTESLAWNLKTTTSATVSISAGNDVSFGPDSSFDGAAKLVVKAGGNVSGDSDFGTVGAVAMAAGKNMTWASNSAVSSKGAIALSAAEKASVDGTLEHAGQLMLTAAALNLSQSSVIKGSGPVDILASAKDTAIINGVVSGAITVGIKVGDATIGEKAVFSDNKQVVVIAGGELVVNGTFTKNASVWLQGVTLVVQHKGAFVANTTCGMQGLVEGDAAALGCKSAAL